MKELLIARKQSLRIVHTTFYVHICIHRRQGIAILVTNANINPTLNSKFQSRQKLYFCGDFLNSRTDIHRKKMVSSS